MEFIAEALGVSSDNVRNVIITLAVVAGVLVLRALTLRWFRSNLSPEDGYRAAKLTNATLTTLAIITLIFIWVDAFSSLTTYLGLVSAGLAIALGDLLKNMAAWLYILTRHPFGVGDRVEVMGVRGDVVDIRLFRFTLMEIGNWVKGEQTTGRLIHVPNGVIFTDDLANYTEGFEEIWEEAELTITFESDVARAEQILRDAMDEAVPTMLEKAKDDIETTSHHYRLPMPVLEPDVFVRVDASGVTLSGRYVVESRVRRRVSSELWRIIIKAVNEEPSVAFAYPTTRTTFEEPIEVTRT